ncbi:hypothetical protein FZC33_11190 [Labrys sp. KNU-23]|uniref:hypothetical protein n=1 Tax=Labrys sp. KNU-23 TaxID=2789216 RepID=UPI0011ECE814|nr:hypothetical protein [Labrys sp. KNU-23]QEN86855.1 hypothetical protein FZC33_11190 [Labrys sp. KNU-23]
MEVWDYLERPNRTSATQAEEDALQKIIAECGAANTALLWLYRVALISHQENEESLDRIERLGRLHRAEIRELQGLPPEEWRDPYRAPQ